MMGVYNKAETMPTCCGACSNKEFRPLEAWYFCLYSGNPIAEEGRLAGCPLIEVKAPHGRLIDADTLSRLLVGEEVKILNNPNLSTVIEAEVE